MASGFNSTGFLGQTYSGTTYSQGLGSSPVSGWFTDSNWTAVPKQATYTPAPAPNVSVVTGVSPLETSYSLYGHIVPLSVFGVGRIGGEIISGPWLDNGNASFIISFGVPADPSGTRTLREIAFDSEVVWTAADGYSTDVPFTFRFYGGTLSQAADALESTHFGADAVAYRPQILIAFDQLPLSSTKFKKIPYVSAVIADATGDDVNLGEAFERLAYSPWVGYTSSQFETVGITDGLVSGGLIFAEDVEFLQAMQNFGRFYPTWDILQTDKLRIVDRGDNVSPDITLDKSRLMDKVVVARQGMDTVKRALELSTIDPDADYTIVPFRAELPRDPVAVTTSVGIDTAYLPAIMDASTRASVTTLAKYHEEQTRKTINGTMMAFGLEMEPGDLIRISDIGDDFSNETFKVTETLHGANYVVEFTAEAILNCEETDPHLGHVVLLHGFEGVNGSQGSPGMTDESPAAHGTPSIPNSPHIDTSQFKYGASSLLITGGAPSVIYSPSADWRLSAANSDQFTVECFVRVNSSFGSPYGCIVGETFTTVTWAFATYPGGELMFKFADTSVVTTQITSSGAGLATGVWYHVAVDKDATGKIRLYKNGVMVGSSTPANSAIYNANDDLIIGAVGIAGAAPFDGWLDELRITKGVARYASDSGFTPPTAAYPRV